MRRRLTQKVHHLKVWRIGMIAPGHAKIAKYELWKEREIEANEEDDRGQPP